MMSPMVTNDLLSVGGPSGKVVMPCEIYNDAKYTFVMMRSGIAHGQMLPFGVAFGKWVKESGFKDVIILSATVSPVKRERESNRELPELFAYGNTFRGEGFYEAQGIRKFGWWLGADKKRPHQELEEMMGGGGGKLLKAFNFVDLPATVIVVFTSGGVDFVGGYTYYNFLKSSFSAESKTLGKVPLVEKTGEEIHDKLFKDKTVKCPDYWAQIIAYF